MRDLLGVTPYHHQAEAAAVGMQQLQEHGSFGLHHEQGCGKTLTTLGMAALLHGDDLVHRVLVVCPASVIGSWQAECRHLPGAMVVALTGPKQRRCKALSKALIDHAAHDGPLIVVTNYEMTWRMEPELRSAMFDLIIADEAQKLKAPGSKQSRAMHRIGKTARFRMNLTGTPTPESELDLYGQLRFMDDRIFGTSYVNFKARYATQIDCGSFTKVVVNRHMLPELERIVHSRTHRATKDAALDLPDQIDVDRPFDLSPKIRKLYGQLAKESIAILEDEFGEMGFVSADSVLTRLLRLQQITGGHVMRTDEGELEQIEAPKLDVLRGELETILESGRKAIVWHRFTPEGVLIRDAAAKLVGSSRKPIEQPYISGAVPASERGEMVRRFQEDDDARVFVAQVQAASTGITLTAADTAIYYSCSFSSGEHEQARARLHRIGQTQKVRHVYLMASGTVDEHVVSSLRAKRSMSESFVDSGWRRWLQGGTS